MTDFESDSEKEPGITPTEMMWRVWAGVIVLPLLLTAVGLFAGTTEEPVKRNVDIAVTGTVGSPRESGGNSIVKMKVDAPLPLRIHIHNGLKLPIRFPSFVTRPVKTHLETQSLAVVSVRRQVGSDEDARLTDDLLEAAPKMDEDAWKQASPSLVEIESGNSTTIQTELRKWQIRGGWTPGVYEVHASVSGIDVDQFSTVSVLSELIHFEIVPVKTD